MMESPSFETYTTLTNAFGSKDDQQQQQIYSINNNTPIEKTTTIYYQQPNQIIYVSQPSDQNSRNSGQNEDLDMITNLIAKDSLFLKDGKNEIAFVKEDNNNHRQVFNHSVNPSVSQNGTVLAIAEQGNNPALKSSNQNKDMHTVHHQPQQQQQPQTSQSQQTQQQPQGSGIFHSMYHPGFDMSNIFQMSQINGHLQNVTMANVPQMTISFANGCAPTMVPTHIQVPLPPPSTSTVVVNNTTTTSTPNRQNSTGSNNGSTSSSSSAVKSRNRNSSDGSMIKCNFCPKKFPTNMVEIHRSECRMIRCHECPQCGKRFKARGGLQQHSRIHMQERSYGCKYCTKRFNQKSHLDQHERIHTGLKPFVCQFCGRGFRQRSQQIGHESTHPAGTVAAAATNSLNSTNSSGIFSVNTTASDSASDNSCGASPANSALPMQSQEVQNKVLQQINNNAVLLTIPTNNNQLLNLITN